VNPILFAWRPGGSRVDFLLVRPPGVAGSSHQSMAGIADSARFFLATDAQRLAKSFAIDASNGSLPTTGTGFTRILFNFSARRLLKGDRSNSGSHTGPNPRFSDAFGPKWSRQVIPVLAINCKKSVFLRPTR
jgi:hypothetical protein